jgi:hypothetical protein
MAEIWLDVVQLYFDFLNGKIKEVPTYSGPLEDDTINQLNDLRELNSLGFLTIDSQDGLDKYETIKENEKTIKIHTQQRAYVTGIMPKIFADKLRYELRTSSNILFMTCDFKSCNEDRKTEKICYDMAYSIPLTIETVDNDEGKIFTASRTIIDCDELYTLSQIFSKNLHKIVLSEFMAVKALDIKFGRSKMLVLTLNTILKKILSEMNQTWLESCNIYSDWGIEKIKEKVISLGLDPKDLSKLQLCKTMFLNDLKTK